MSWSIPEFEAATVEAAKSKATIELDRMAPYAPAPHREILLRAIEVAGEPPPDGKSVIVVTAGGHDRGSAPEGQNTFYLRVEHRWPRSTP